MAGANSERLHDAIAIQCPSEVRGRSRKAYQGPPELAYPFHDKEVLATCCGHIYIPRKKVNIGAVMVGQRVALKEIEDAIRLVSFIHYDLG